MSTFVELTKNETMSEIKYPIGIQTFEKIITEGYRYVDKTKYIFDIVSKGQFYFLSRPRRFGKSLLLTTIEALFKGKRELFRGLAIDSMEWDWQPHEVLHLDLNLRNYREEDSLTSILDVNLKHWEKLYNIEKESDKLVDRFASVIRKAYEISGRGVVILIDEYDKPLVATISDKKLQKAHRNQLQAFYGVLKSLDQYIKFGMLTGVSRFSKVSIFSGLNNLQDISLLPEFNGLCGISETELNKYFAESMADMAKAMDMTVEEIHDELKTNYDGYHFASVGEDIYNPFSLLNTFKGKMFGSYWFSTGTTSDLVEILENATFAIPELEGYHCKENLLTGSDIYLTNPVPLFFQTGYLTIKGYNSRFKQYILGFPNKEVAEGFSDFLMNSYMRGRDSSQLISEFVLDVEAGRPEAFMSKLKSFTAGIPYDLIRKENGEEYSAVGWITGDKEVHYQNVMFVVMKLMGFYTHTEYKTSDGRMDMVVETPDYVYLMEFKIDSTPEEALQQINEKEYALPFELDHRKLFKIGANFDTKTRRLENWIIESKE